MLRPRVIPCLLVHDKGLVKTVKFRDPRYVGDPINAVKIFNEKEADELVVLDIDASVQGREPDFGMIRKLAAECRMPLCYGGGVRTVEQARSIIALGVEKVALSSGAIERPALIGEIAAEIGTQSVVVILDAKKKLLGSRYEVCVHNAKSATGLCPIEFAREAVRLGAGEILVNSIDNDGVMRGYDMALAERVRAATNVPLTILGGAGSLADIGALIDRFGVIGASAGSLFVFKGPYRAVLISYPTSRQRDELIDGVSRRVE